MKVINIGNLSYDDAEKFRKMSYVIELHMDVNDMKSISLEEIMESGILGEDFSNVAITIARMMEENPGKYSYGPHLTKELTDKYSCIDDYILDGGSIYGLDMKLTLEQS